MTSDPGPELTAPRRATLHAVVMRVLPGTHGPGAARTAAHVGVERALREPALGGLRPAIEALLDALDADAAQAYGTPFAACATGNQEALLRGVAQAPNPVMRFLFRALIGLSLEGLLGDPGHGGNRDSLGWRAIGLQAEDVRSGRCRDSQESTR
jgi:hypothetical protein